MSYVLNTIPDFSHEGDERTRHAETPDDEEHEQLDGLQGLVRAPQPLEGEVGLGVHVGVKDLAEYPPCLQPVGPHVKHILETKSSLNITNSGGNTNYNTSSGLPFGMI